MADQLVIDGLRIKLAELAADMRATEQRLKTLAADKGTVLAALRLFDANPSEQPGAVSLGIQTGAFSRTILDTIREAGKPVSVRQIAGTLAMRVGRPLNKKETNMLIARVRAAMVRLSDKLDGELRDRTTFWSVKGVGRQKD